MAENAAIPFEAKYSEDLGCYLVAKNDIPAGEVFFTEPPLFLYSQFGETAKNNNVLLCTCCYRLIRMEYAVHCKRCHWPFCNKECTKDPVHTNLECDIFRKRKVKRTPNSLEFLYLVRCFQMKKKEKSKWVALNNLCSTTYTKKKNPEYFETMESMAEGGASFLKRVCHMDADKEEIKKLINIFKVNSFSMDVESKGLAEVEESFCAVYAISCLISHGCAHNTDWHIRSGDGWSMELCSRVDIAQGEPLRICYMSDVASCGLIERRSLLYQDFGFICKCERCLDPTELGTFYSTLKCPRCPKGALHPTTSMSHKHRCRKCTFSLTEDQVAWVEGRFSGQLEQIISNSTDTESRLEKLEELITTASSRFGLHPNHFLVHKATIKWLPTLDKDVLLEDSEESLNTYHNILVRTKPILETLRLFGASSSRQLKLEFMIVSAITRYHFKSPDCLEIVQDVEDLQEKMKIIARILKHLSRGVGASKYFSRTFWPLVEEMKEQFLLWRSRLKECHQELLASQCSGNSQDSDEGPSSSAHSPSASSQSSLHHN